VKERRGEKGGGSERQCSLAVAWNEGEEERREKKGREREVSPDAEGGLWFISTRTQTHRKKEVGNRKKRG